MIREPVTMFCTNDFSGQMRGKGFPARDLRTRLDRGIGWTPTNMMITAYGPIADPPWGPFGDLMLRPDPHTEVRLDFEDGGPVEHWFLSDIAHTDGSPWVCCLRTLLRETLARLRAETGLSVVAGFEHEFMYAGANQRPGDGYAMDALRRADLFPEIFTAAMNAAGVPLECFMPEYAEAQFEATIAATDGLAAADRAVILREVARATAWRLDETVTFVPLPAPDAVGNGLHVHLSLIDAEGRPVMYDAGAPHGLSPVGAAFAAGIVRHMPALTAVMAPSPVSALRLRPNRWSACWSNLGARDREAGVRIAPTFDTPGSNRARQFNIEYRAADATGSPYLQLALLVAAGLEGLRANLAAPLITHNVDPGTMTEAERDAAGIHLLPQSLGAALDALEADPVACGWMPDDLRAAYLRFKRAEIGMFADLDPEAQCARVAQAY